MKHLIVNLFSRLVLGHMTFKSNVLFLFCLLFLVSCSSENSSSRTNGSSSSKVITFEGEHPDSYTLIMFTCDRFGVKSKLAASYFNQRATELNLSYRASAKSLNMTESSAKMIPSKVIKDFRKRGINIKNPAIVGFRTKDIDKTENVIMLDDYSRYGTHDKFIDWTDLDGGPSIEDFGLENIKSKVDALLLNY